MDQDKKKKLTGYLAELSEEEMHKLTTAVELKRLKGEEDPAQDLIMDSLRPVLAQSMSTPPRLMTPMRLFCFAFEDMLYPIDVSEKEPGRIMRSSLMPIWGWLSDDLLPDVFATLEEKIKEAILAGDRDATERSVADLREKAAQAMREAMADMPRGSDPYKNLASRLGGDLVLEDARDIAMTLHIAPQLVAMMQNYPQPLIAITDADIHYVHECYGATIGQNKADCVHLIFLSLMGRFQHPWKILRVIRGVTGVKPDELFSHPTYGDPGRVLMHDVSKFTAYFEQLPGSKLEPHDVLENLAYFVQMVDGIVEESALTEQSECTQALLSCRARVAESMEKVLAKVPAIMRAAIPSQSRGSFGRKSIPRPDTSKWPDPDIVEEAIDQAILIDGTGQLAQQAAFMAQRNETVAELTTLLSQYGEKICEEIHAAEGETRQKAEAHAETAVLLTRYVIGEEAADLLRRHVKSAAA